jgi:hypothetical protein
MTPPQAPSDEELLDAVRELFDRVDPPPDDLAEGVLARIGVEDLELEYELLSLVDTSGLAGTVRASTDATGATTDESVTLEFAGGSFRVLLRIDTVERPSTADEGDRRVDGWVVPAVPMRVSLVADPEDGSAPGPERRTTPDENGRFELTEVPRGRYRVWLHPEPAPDGRATLHPFATLPFLI